MYSSPFLIRKGFHSLFFLIQYAIANDPGFQAVYQEDSLAAPPLTLDNTSPVIFDPSQFTTPFTSGSASSQTSTDPSETYPDPQDGNNSENFLVSNEYCNNAAKQPYPSRRRRKRQNEQNFCDNPTPGASNRLENNNEIAKPKSPTQNSVPNPNNSGQVPNKTPQPPSQDIGNLRLYMYSLPGIDGETNPAACNIREHPLFQVPVCAPPLPQSAVRSSPASFIAPSKFMPAEGCDKTTEETWCCIAARETDYESLTVYLPPGRQIPNLLMRYPATGLSCVQVL